MYTRGSLPGRSNPNMINKTREILGDKDLKQYQNLKYDLRALQRQNWCVTGIRRQGRLITGQPNTSEKKLVETYNIRKRTECPITKKYITTFLTEDLSNSSGLSKEDIK